MENFNLIRHGCTETVNYDGGKAFFFDNPGGWRAKDWLDLNDSALGTENFTVSLWIKCNPIPWNRNAGAANMLRAGEFVDRERQNADELMLGGTLCANRTLFSSYDAGFYIGMLQPHAYMTLNLFAEGMEKPVQFTGIREGCDTRWHLLTVTADRQGKLCLYVDDELRAEQDISMLRGVSFGGENLRFGADTNGNFGFGKGALSEIIFERQAWTKEKVAERFGAGALRRFAIEIQQRIRTDGLLYDKEMLNDFLEKVESAGAERYHALKDEYAEILKHPARKPDVKLMLISDEHCEGVGRSRTEAVRGAYRWAREEGVDAVINGGDYSFMGTEEEFTAYWDVIHSEWAGRPLFLAPGNHETLTKSCTELVDYHCARMAEQGMIPKDWRKFYFDGEVNGYHVIVLSQYSDTYNFTGPKRMWRFAGDIKQEQLDFLEDKLKKYCSRGKPVFLVIHNGVESLVKEQVGDAYSMDGVIIEGEGLYRLLANHPDCVLCTGHAHHGLGMGGFFALKEGYNTIDMPGVRGSTVGYGPEDRDEKATRRSMYFLNVYGNVLQLRAVNMDTREWLTEYDQTVTVG